MISKIRHSELFYKNHKRRFLVKSEVKWEKVVGNVSLFNTFVKVVYIFQGSIWLFLQASMSVS